LNSRVKRAFPGSTTTGERDPNHTVRMLRVNHKMTLKDALGLYERLLLRDKSTIYVYEVTKTVRRFMRGMEERSPADLSEKDVARGLGRLYHNIQVNTASHYSIVIHGFFEYMKWRNFVGYNWVQKHDIHCARPKAFFDTIQLDIMFENLPAGELRDALRVIYHTGIPRRDLDRIVGVDMVSGQLILRDRRVTCPEHVLLSVQRRRFFDAERVGFDFRQFMKQFEFVGTLRYLVNSYVVRQHLAGTPTKVIQNQLAMTRSNKVGCKVNRLMSAPLWHYEFAKRHPFHDYY
jgi:hypothetical protein